LGLPLAWIKDNLARVITRNNVRLQAHIALLYLHTAMDVVALRSFIALTCWFSGFNRYKLLQKRPPSLVVCAATAVAAVLYDRSFYGVLIAVACFWHGQRLKCIGLTGGIAAGKSAVSAQLRQLGAVIIDADKIAHGVLRQGQPAYARVVEHFGNSILESDGSINRARLREVIASNDSERRFLNSVTHPLIGVELLKRYVPNTRKFTSVGLPTSNVICSIAWQKWILGHPVVIDAPLLFESGMVLRYLCSPIIVVAVSQDVQLARVIKRDSSSKELAERLIAAQMPQDRKVALADIVIQNNGSLEQLEATTRRVWKQVNGNSAPSTHES
jgi:dephospho-CoA kinase